MPSIVFGTPKRVLCAIAVFASSVGCAASSSTAAAPREPRAHVSKPSSVTVAKRPAVAPSNQRTSQRAPETGGAVFDTPAEVIALEIEGTNTKEPMLPCRLLITHYAGTMVLDFHAQPGSAPRIRQQTQDLVAYLNDNRDDEQAARSPGGRPDPASFPVRQILGARPVASVEDLPDGARLTLSPEKGSSTGRLRAEVLWHAGDLLPGLPLEGKTCPELPARPLAVSDAP
jgi:hypothetical protein